MDENNRHGMRISLWSPIRLAYGQLPVISILERHGIDASRLLEQAGIDRFGLMDPAYTISIDQELVFLNAVLRAIPDPALSLEMAREYRLRGFSVLGLAMQASESPLQMLQTIIRYPRLAWGMFEGELNLGADSISIRFLPQPRLGAIEGFLAERDLACALVMFEEATESRFPIQSLSFRHACAAKPEIYEAFFGCKVSFEAARTELRVSRQAAEQALPHADASICAFYSAQCERMSRGMDQPFRYSEAVRQRLLRSSVVPNLGELAQSMLLTPRTLQRRLSSEGVSFSELLRDARQQRATQLLSESSLSMEQISATLGFSDAVAFSHAFKAWTGRSPQAWRTAAEPG